MSIESRFGRRTLLRGASLAALSLVAGCGGGSESGTAPASREFAFDFNDGQQEWAFAATDLPLDYAPDIYELASSLSALPAPLDGSRRGLMVQGHNRSDDLFLFVKRRVSGLTPGTRYRAAFDVEFASDAPSSFAGIGGPPGLAVTVKAGVNGTEPVPVVQAGYYRFNLDKGNQSVGGADALVLGDVGIPGDKAVYQLKRLQSDANGLAVQTDAAGSLWLFVGFDSGFEGKSVLYLTRVGVRLTPLS